MRQTLGDDAVLVDAASRRYYANDIFWQPGILPEAIVLPSTQEHAAEAIKLACDAGLAVVPRGGGMSYSMGYLPATSGAIVVDATRLTRVADNRIDYEEYRNSMMRRFGNADRNDDGVLRGDELPQHMVVIREAAKVGSDGSVTLDAFTESLKPVFGRFDANHDGVLEGEEIDAFARARAALQEVTP